jgi:sec-independent protein translocase protein TatB
MMAAMDLGMPEILFIFVLALILFGPKKLPEIGRQIGKAMAEFKRASREFRSQIEDEVRNLEIDAELKEMKNTIAPPSLLDSIASSPPNTAVSASAAEGPGTMTVPHPPAGSIS